MEFDWSSSQTVSATALLVALLSIALLVLLTRRRSLSRGNSLLLLGPSYSGKTAILSSLVYGQNLPTLASFQTNSAIYTDVDGPTKRSFKVVDIPGHPRIRDQFQTFLPEARAIAFVVDASTISRNGPAVAEHLHVVMNALTLIPPNQPLPALVILAHKSDLLKSNNVSTDTESLAINRVKSILERELDKRRTAQSSSVGIEGLGEEGMRSEMGGLECTGSSGSPFRFVDWEGGDVGFISTCLTVQGEKLDEKREDSDGLRHLRGWLSQLS